MEKVDSISLAPLPMPNLKYKNHIEKYEKQPIRLDTPHVFDENITDEQLGEFYTRLYNSTKETFDIYREKYCKINEELKETFMTCHKYDLLIEFMSNQIKRMEGKDPVPFTVGKNALLTLPHISYGHPDLKFDHSKHPATFKGSREDLIKSTSIFTNIETFCNYVDKGVIPLFYNSNILDSYKVLKSTLIKEYNKIQEEYNKKINKELSRKELVDGFQKSYEDLFQHMEFSYVL